MPIVQAVLSPAGPYSGTVPTITAYVDDGSGNPDTSYAGQTVVLCLDCRSNANPESAYLNGTVAAVLDGSGEASFSGLTLSASYWDGNTSAYLVGAVLPDYTWTPHYYDDFTASDNTRLAARDNGALTGPITGYLPGNSPNYFEWTDGAIYARIYGNAVELWDNSSHPHGTNGEFWYGYAWDAVTSGNNVKRDCRMRAEITPIVQTFGVAGEYGVVGFMPNSFGYTDYQGVCNFTPNTGLSFSGLEAANAINYYFYDADKFATRGVSSPADNTTFTYEVWNIDGWMFVLIDDVFELGMAIDALTVTTAGPYMDNTSDWDVKLRFDNFTLDTPSEAPPPAPFESFVFVDG